MVTLTGVNVAIVVVWNGVGCSGVTGVNVDTWGPMNLILEYEFGVVQMIGANVDVGLGDGAAGGTGV